MPLMHGTLGTAYAPAGPHQDSWSARWIWAPTDTADMWVAFRKTFVLGAAPTAAPTRIAADTKYWLYVNGSLVIFEGGLKRGPNPGATYYDERDIAPFLRGGPNVIAVLVWHLGKSGFSHSDSQASGLLLQSDIITSGVATTIATDGTWKQRIHAGYQHETTGSQPNYRLPEWNIFYDARRASSMQGWEAPGYNDGAWDASTDKGPAGAPPWNTLVRRPIPLFTYSDLLDYTNSGAFPAAGPTTIIATLPSNLQVTPYLKVEAASGAAITIQSDHYTDGGEANVRSTYITAGGVQEFESLGWMSGTAIHYQIPSGVTVLALKYRESGYATSFAGSFTSDVPFFDKLWQKAARTVYLNMRDSYMDCPTRERAQWWGDAANDMKGGFYAFDTRSYALGKKAIGELVKWQKPGGELYSPIPSGTWTQELPLQSLAAIASFWTYYQYTGDATAIDTTYDAVKRYLDLWTLDGDGLVNHRPGEWDWPDWGENADVRALENAWYTMALDTAINLATMTGNGSDRFTWQARRDSIERNFNRVLWDSTSNAYRSPGYRGDTDDRANGLAVVAGLAEPANYPAIRDVLRSHYNASPYMEFYVLEALYRMGYASDAQDRMIDRYTPQVDDPGYTLWEFWTKGGMGTDNHGWSVGPLYTLSAYAAGVRPTQPGYSAYQITPQLGRFSALSATVPTIKGDVAVDIRRPSPGRLAMNITSPAGTRARIGIPRAGMARITITANNVTVYDRGSAGQVAGLSYAGNDAAYIYFIANPGTWSFNAQET